jgi:hypothetical protein
MNQWCFALATKKSNRRRIESRQSALLGLHNCGEGTLHIVSEDEVVAFRMLVPECNKICGIEIVRRPFALDSRWSLSVGRNHKV